ncbi:MAG: hypothetical protein RPR91_03330 [Colwellia sp.]|jgi:hypothetical protein
MNANNIKSDVSKAHKFNICIPLDLEYGVNVSYGKFGDLLGVVKAITGKTPEK